MADEKGEEFSAVELAVEAGIDPRTGGNWAKWEQSRIRSFLSAAEQPIDSKKLLGKVRNLRMTLSKERSGETFIARMTVSLEENVGPYRIHKGSPPLKLLDSAGKVLAQFSGGNFARQCGGWRKVEWAHDITPDAFEAASTISIIGDVELRRC